MTVTTKAWKNKGEPGAQELTAAEVIDVEERLGAYADSLLAGGAVSGTGTLKGIYHAIAGQGVQIRFGTEASPNKTVGPVVQVSRTLEIAESAFEGDGADTLGAIQGVTKAVSGSQGQAIGVVGGASTDGSYVGSSSNSDAVGGYFVGTASSASSNSRAGIGLFALGRRDSESAATTGAEIVSTNETEKEGTVQTTGAADTKALWVHCTGKKNSAYAIQIGKTTRSFLIGVGFNTGSVSAASIRDDSEAQFSLRVRGTHSKAAISVLKTSGVVLLGTTTEEAIEPAAYLESPFIRMNSTGLNFNGGTPVAIKAAGAETTAALWARLKELGLCT